MTIDKKYLKRVFIYVFAVIFSVGMAVYIGYHIRKAVISEIKTAPAEIVSKSRTVNADAYIVRSETVLRPNSSGVSYPSAEDAAHVAQGSAVSGIYSRESDASWAEISELRARIKMLKAYSSSGHSAKDASEADRRIYSLMEQIRRLTESQDIQGALLKRTQLLCELSERKAVSQSGAGTFEDIIRAAQSRLDSLTSSLGAVTETVYSPSSGWYFSQTDGYESIFSPSGINKLTPSRFNELVSAQPKSTEGDAGKVVTSYTWYIVLKTAEENIEGMTEGRYYDVAFPYNSGKTLSMALESLVTDKTTGESVLVLSSGVIEPAFSFLRCQNVEITAEVMNGLSVPKKAIRIIDGVPGVFIHDGGVYVSFRRIHVLKEFDDYCLVSADGDGEDETDDTKTADNDAETETGVAAAPFLSHNDLIITEGKELYDGRVIA